MRLIEDVPDDGVRGHVESSANDPDVLLVGDVAQKLAIGRTRVLQLEALQQLRPWTTTPGGVRLYLKAEVDAFLVARSDASLAAKTVARQRAQTARGERRNDARVRALNAADLVPRRMLKAGWQAKANGSSLQDPAAKGAQFGRKSGRVA